MESSLAMEWDGKMAPAAENWIGPGMVYEVLNCLEGENAFLFLL